MHCHGAASRCCLSMPQASSFALPPSNASWCLGRILYWLFHNMEQTHNERYPYNKKNYHHHLHIRAIWCASFGRGDNFPIHCDEWTFVSTSWPYTQGSSPVLTFFRKISSAFKRSISWNFTYLLFFVPKRLQEVKTTTFISANHFHLLIWLLLIILQHTLKSHVFYLFTSQLHATNRMRYPKTIDTRLRVSWSTIPTTHHLVYKLT